MQLPAPPTPGVYIVPDCMTKANPEQNIFVIFFENLKHAIP